MLTDDSTTHSLSTKVSLESMTNVMHITLTYIYGTFSFVRINSIIFTYFFNSYKLLPPVSLCLSLPIVFNVFLYNIVIQSETKSQFICLILFIKRKFSLHLIRYLYVEIIVHK